MSDEPRWFHCTTHTYGAWLYGDSRGFRTRHHREHIVGDYKSPPPSGMYASKLARSKALLKQPMVTLTPKWRPTVGRVFRDKLLELGAQVLCVSISSTHAHVLVKMPSGPVPRQWIGRAKVAANFICKDHGWTGKLWAIRSKITPIDDRKHQLNAFHYILNHVDEGASVWDFRDGAEHPGRMNEV